MESQRLCAYNQTRECFLGLEVASADLSVADLRDLLGKLALKSGEGLWMEPFRGIPETNMRAPLDLIYLDDESSVIEVVESFPTFHVTPMSPQAASVLALPTHSIYSSQTQPGDQLVLCVAEEMQNRLERYSNSSSGSGGVQSAVQLRGKPLWSGGSAVVELEDQSSEESLPSGPPFELDIVEQEMENVKPRRGWLERWWSPEPQKAPDPRKASRGPSFGLAAYYWTGAPPKAHVIRDISSTGMYILTEERWYPGTVILMTLQDADDEDGSNGRSISVHSRTVRWGNDGVGLQFIPDDDPSAHNGPNALVAGANRAELDLFLEQIRRGKV